MPSNDFTTCRNNFSADKLLKTLQKSEEQYPPLKAEEEKKLIADYLAAGKEDELLSLLENMRREERLPVKDKKAGREVLDEIYSYLR